MNTNGRIKKNKYLISRYN